MKHSSDEIILVAFIYRKLFVKEGIFDNTATALSSYEEIRIRRVTTESDLAIREKRVEITVSLEADLTRLKRLVPIAEAVVTDGTTTVLEIKSRLVLVAVAEIVAVTATEIAEGDAVRVELGI